MYFSLIDPAPGHERSAAHDWIDAYAEHQWLWRFFPAEEGAPRDFLYRRRDVDGFPRFYVVSRRPPQPYIGAWRVQTREYRPMLEVGTRLQFELRANPVIARTVDEKHRRHDVVMERKKRLLEERGLARWEEWPSDRKSSDGQPDPRPGLYELVQETCAAWLKERAEKHGFSIDSATLAMEAYQQHGGKKGQLRFSSVDFSGQLTVTDPLAFGKALRDGIGHAKAFGCGLLLIRRA